MHVTLRVQDDIPSLRSSRRFAAIRRSFAASRGLHGMRLVHFTVLGNHLHLIVEADGSGALATGMQGLNVRLAKALNAVLGRKGRVFADHYHGRLLLSPTEVRNALDYVKNNAEHHYGEKGVRPLQLRRAGRRGAPRTPADLAPRGRVAPRPAAANTRFVIN